MHTIPGAVVVVGLLLASCRGAPPPQDRVDFIFTDGEWESYQSRIEEGSRKEFSLSVRLGAHQDYVRATAHLRGASSFNCARRNYTLNLYGRRPRFASFDSVTDEFFLLSLCRDRGFVRQHTGLKLWSALGLFPLQMRYVELRLNERSRGVYLLVEKLDRIRLSSDALRVLLRRDFRRGSTRVEVKHSAQGEKREREHYAWVTAELTGLSGELLIERFREHMDLDQYLTWMASNTLLQNGDSVDELWLIGRENLRAPHGTDTYYTFFAWDADDIFQPCHADGEHAFRDPHGLVFCAEAEWDHLLLGDPLGYALYVDVLEGLVDNRLTPEVFDAALANTGDALLRLLERQSVAEAMAKVSRPNESVLELERLSDSFEQSWELLKRRIERYRRITGSAKS